MFEINQGRINLALSSAAFAISSAGSVLLHVVLAVTVFGKTGSSLMTSMFVALQWLPALLVVLYRSDWDRGIDPRVRWWRLELASAALTLPLLLLIGGGNYLAVAAVLLVRGLADQVNRINKTVAARVLFPKAKATHYASFLQTSYHFGIALAAVVGIATAGSLDIRWVALIDALTFVVAAGLIAITRCVEKVEEGGEPSPPRPLAARVAEYRSALRNDRRLLVCALLPPLTATFFQGTYSALQPIFPIQKLSLDSAAVSASYIIVSAAVLAGSSAFSFFCKKYRLFEQPFARTQLLAVLLSIAAAALYFGAVWTGSTLASAAQFGLMVLVFEFVWMMGYTGIVAFAPKGQLGSVFGISFALGCFFASVLATLTGALLEVLGGAYTTLIGLLMVGYLSILAAVVLSYSPSGAAVEANGRVVEPS